jgi:hypothetical protein
VRYYQETTRQPTEGRYFDGVTDGGPSPSAQRADAVLGVQLWDA